MLAVTVATSSSAIGRSLVPTTTIESVAERGTFSRAAPVVLANVLYSGNFETPAASWTDKINRGHLTATRIYDPKDPNQSDELQLWDAGLILTNTEPSARTIFVRGSR